MDELNGLLNGNDVSAKVGVDVIEKGGQCGGLAGAGGAGDQDEAAAQVAKLFDDWRDAELFKGGNFSGDDPKNRAVAELLAKVVAAEPAVGVHLIGEVEISLFTIPLPGTRFANLTHHGLHDVLGENLVGDGLDGAVDAHFGRLSLGEMEVGASQLDEGLKVLVDDWHGSDEMGCLSSVSSSLPLQSVFRI